MEIGQNTYKLILLDTNVLREIVRNTNLAGKGFLQKFFSGKDKYAPCFSIYNALELMPYEDIFEDFLEFFSSIPCLMTFPVKSILQEEYACYLEGKAFKFTNQIAYAFTPYLEKESYNCKSFFNNLKKSTDLIAAIHSDIDEFPSIAKDWEEQRTNAIQMLKQLKLPLDMIDEKFYKSQEMKTVIKDLTNFNIPGGADYILPAKRNHPDDFGVPHQPVCSAQSGDLDAGQGAGLEICHSGQRKGTGQNAPVPFSVKISFQLSDLCFTPYSRFITS